MIRVLETNIFLYRRIAWPRLGGIAYISPDGSEVRFRCLRFHSTTAKWGLSKDYAVVKRPMTDEHHPFVHLEWSQTGMDLAVADTVGRISVFTFSPTAVNHSSEATIAAIDQPTELDRAVGMLWLNPDRPVRFAQGWFYLQIAKKSFRQ